MSVKLNSIAAPIAAAASAPAPTAAANETLDAVEQRRGAVGWTPAMKGRNSPAQRSSSARPSAAAPCPTRRAVRGPGCDNPAGNHTAMGVIPMKINT